MKDFSEKLKKRLKERDIAQYELATKIQMTPAGLNIMISNNNPKIETLEKICEILEVDLDYFLELKPKSVGPVMRMLEEANNEVHRWKMRAFELEEKMGMGNFRKLSRYTNSFFCLQN